MNRFTLRRLLYTVLCAIAVGVTAALAANATALVVAACLVCFLICGSLYKFDYLHPSVAYSFPWLMILVFSLIPISEHARPVESVTYAVLLANLLGWLLACANSPPAITARSRDEPRFADTVDLFAELRGNFAPTVTVAFVVLFVFAAINVAIAGYVPLLSLITTGDSRYADFGVKSVFGAFLAYANALACVALYLYLRSRRRKYLMLFLSVLVMHLVFVTRQNIATLLIEAFVIRSLSTRRLSNLTLVWSIVLSLLAFSALGTLRSGDINAAIGVQRQYNWIPTPLIWVYAYSYFNILNIDNTIVASGAPFFDGYMWRTLLPSIYRPDVEHGTFLELSSMNVSSYVSGVYIDIGKWVVLWTYILGYATSVAYRKALTRRRFIDVARYSCLYFCALLSFFIDFWLYLPVIFQLFFFQMFHGLLFKPQPSNAKILRAA